MNDPMIIAIDGAARNNGKPHCVSAGGLYIRDYGCSQALATFETRSTNQRGEMLALRLAMQYAANDTFIITDSEYLFNAMTKNWCDKWAHNGWRTASGDLVKNMDLWQQIHAIRKDVNFYHIKGHCISLGKVTAARLLATDYSGELLYQEALKKFDSSTKDFSAVQELSIKNNGFRLDPGILRTFIALNTVADAIATKEVEQASAAYRDFHS